MTRALAHRGPDGENIWIEGQIGFGQARDVELQIAVIDAQVEGGRSPAQGLLRERGHQVLGGEPRQPDSRVDQMPEPPLSGGAPQPPAKKDAGAGPEWGVDGDVAQPDAGVDKSDMTAAPGFMPQPDAAIDCDGGGSCPNP